MKPVIALVLSAVLLAGCGAVGEDEPAYKNIEAVADAISCVDLAPEEEAMIFAAETATCTLAGDDYVTINWFNNNDARDKYVELGTDMGAVYIVGDKWAVECDTTKQQEAVAESTKGNIPD